MFVLPSAQTAGWSSSSAAARWSRQTPVRVLSSGNAGGWGRCAAGRAHRPQRIRPSWTLLNQDGTRRKTGTVLMSVSSQIKIKKS